MEGGHTQWLLQDFEDTRKLGDALSQQGLAFSWHKVVPFVGDLLPAPVIVNRDAVVMFGAYTLWRYAQNHGLTPGVFMVSPFVDEVVWHPYLLNGADSVFMTLAEIPDKLPNDDTDWFLRPVDDSKAEPGRVRSAREIITLAKKVLDLNPHEIPLGSLRHDTQLMLSAPMRILSEWRLWVIEDQIVTYSLYKEGARVVYRPEIPADALAFARHLVALNPGYCRAYVLDICRTDTGLRMLETNCINAAGFYAADLGKLVTAIEALQTP